MLKLVGWVQTSNELALPLHVAVEHKEVVEIPLEE